MKRAAWILLLLLAAGVFVFSAAKLYGYFRQNSAAVRFQEGLVQAAVSEPEQGVAAQGDSESVPPIQVDFTALLARYPDLVAWLYSPDTPIHYPIVQSGDNSYYLRRLPDGTDNPHGSLFLDYRNSADFTDWNLIVYGHNMKTEDMFGTLDRYQQQSYYEAHPVLYLLTPEADYRIRLIGGCVTAADSAVYTIPADAAERDRLVELVLQDTTFVSGERVGEGESLITLSTCTYAYDGARYVLLGALERLD